ncbi:hypothetical protein DQ04_00141090 [Trypanosoma grayi]|uniref:hypothetical protein n=1 Tax=Trypanosoma grayi TaxID=71804 RepID=UPI0004F411E1|nr:hypothetical protein DQ04_00141090 [Trypanosoma grayi]KEG15221.1 hypothetical protein DQ04_00141090 [Trypanosoma grayi]
MGAFASRGSGVPNSTRLAEEGDAENVLRDFDMSAPTAAVIGAGIAGVHVAYELARLGFRVTVFEQHRGIALGETQYSLPFIGVGFLHPYIYTLRMRRELLRGTLSFACPDIISVEDSWNSFFSAAIHRWLWARRWSALSPEQVMRYTNNLSHLSVGVVEEMVNKHQSLAPYILSRDVSVGVLATTPHSDDEVTAMPTSHPAPLMIDPVGWTREVAKIANEKYGVQFALGERLLDMTTYLRYDAEMVSTLRFSREVEGRVECNNRRFDVVVLTAGAQTGELTWGSSQLPIIGLGGCSVALQSTAGKALAHLTRVLSTFPTGMVSLSPRSHLIAYKTPRSDDATGDVSDVDNDVGETIVLQGLLSFDTTKKTQPSLTGTLSRLEAYLRVKCGLEVPLLREYQQQQQEKRQHQYAGSNNGEADTSSGSISVTRYIRAFTPDGVPLISNNGAAFNSFVCAGFGDHALDMAPGSARILAKLVEVEACVMLHDDEDDMKQKGRLVDGVMAEGRLAHVRQELQLLLNGFLTPSTPSSQGQAMETFSQNPFSSTRFHGVVKDEVHDVTHISLLHRLSNIETRLVQACEPLNHYINQKAIKLARQDNMPDWLRTIVYYYFNDVEDDEKLKESWQKYAEGIQRIRKEFEGSSHSSSSSSP